MTGRQLGKIDFAEFGTNKDYPFHIGLQPGFQLGDKTWIRGGGRYTVNINPDCKWESKDKSDSKDEDEEV